MRGGDDNDTLVGGSGADRMAGGAGIDTADYTSSPGGVTVNLNNGKGSRSDAEGDQLRKVENVIGTSGVDIIQGNLDNNVLDGGAGDGDEGLAAPLPNETLFPITERNINKLHFK